MTKPQWSGRYVRVPEKKMFFKTFIREIEVMPSEVTIEYKAPMQV